MTSRAAAIRIDKPNIGRYSPTKIEIGSIVMRAGIEASVMAARQIVCFQDAREPFERSWREIKRKITEADRTPKRAHTAWK